MFNELKLTVYELLISSSTSILWPQTLKHDSSQVANRMCLKEKLITHVWEMQFNISEIPTGVC